MARKNTAIDSEDGNVGGTENARSQIHTVGRDFTHDAAVRQSRTTMKSQPSAHSLDNQNADSVFLDAPRDIKASAKQGPEVATKALTTRKVRLLPPLNSLAAKSEHLRSETIEARLATPYCSSATGNKSTARATPARTAKTTAARRGRRRIIIDSSDESEADSDSGGEIWCDARSDASFIDSEPTSEIDSSPVRWPGEKLLPLPPSAKVPSKERRDIDLSAIVRGTDALRLEPLEKKKTTSRKPNVSISDQENRTPSSELDKTVNSISRPTTPPAQRVTPPVSPSKSRLQSPSKKKIRIPTPPGRPSIDAFWDPAQINAWNESYSPTKPLLSPRKLHRQRLSEDDDDLSVPPSPSKCSSPRKSRAEIAARRAFDAAKASLATSLLTQLDEGLCSGAVGRATASTGGVKIIWSRTLNSTAGRATWRRTQVDEQEAKHFASIELAEKVLTDERRLRNTLAHEFCHLATYIVSGVKDRPHGKEFRAWGRKAEVLLEGVKVSTRHDYVMEWKYVWECTGCGIEYGRHSRSIDTARVRCGGCQGSLVQTRPAPRKVTGEKVKGFAGFTKEMFATVRKELEKRGSVTHGAVMEELGRRWRDKKAGESKAIIEYGDEKDEVQTVAPKAEENEKDGIDALVRGLEVIVIND